MRSRAGLAVGLGLVLGALALGCASSEKLTQRSEQWLLRGDAGRALQAAEDALDKDAANPAARAALQAAGDSLRASDRRRFYALLYDDTLGAARVALDDEALVARLARRRVTPLGDAEYERDLTRARESAADGLMRAAADSLRRRRARPAYRLLEQAAVFAPHRRDLDARLARTFEQAVDRVAVLPFDDRIGQPDLLRPLTARLATAVAERIARQPLRFTRLIEPSKVYARMTVDRLGDLDREEAIALGRQVGADVVVWGRLSDAHTETTTDHYREPLWVKVTERLSDGSTQERWESRAFEVIERERVYRLRWVVEALDTEDEVVLERREDVREAHARTVWSDFRPDRDPRDYALVPPDVRTKEPRRHEAAQKQWKATAGSWAVSDLLDRCRASNVSSRAAYRREYRSEFEHYDRDRPVFLGALPGPEDMAWLALRDLDGQVVSMVRGLDAR